jgi:hypothetical protein
MNQGIRPNQRTDADLGHLGLAPDTLQGAMDMARQDSERFDVDTRAITREVRMTLEDVFVLLSDALPTKHG